MNFEPVPISFKSKFFVSFNDISDNPLFQYISTFINLDLNDQQTKDPFLKTCYEILSNNLLQNLAMENPLLIDAFAYAFLDNFEKIIVNIPDESLLEIAKTGSLTFIDGWLESFRMALLAHQLKFYTDPKFLAISCEEAIDNIIQCDDKIAILFLTNTIDHVQRFFKMMETTQEIDLFRISFNKIFAKVISEKPLLLADANLNKTMQNSITGFDLLSPSPEILIQNPSLITLSSTLTISIIIGLISSYFEGDIENLIDNLFASAPYQTKDCLIYYTTKFKTDFRENFLEKNENSRLAAIYCFENYDRSLYMTNFFPYAYSSIKKHKSKENSSSADLSDAGSSIDETHLISQTPTRDYHSSQIVWEISSSSDSDESKETPQKYMIPQILHHQENPTSYDDKLLSFFSNPTSDELEILLKEDNDDLIHILGYAIEYNLNFDPTILVDLLEKYINNLRQDLRNLEFRSFIASLRTNITIIEALVKKYGFNSYLIEQISCIIDEAMICPILMSKKNITFLTEETKCLLSTLILLSQKVPDEFLSYSFSHCTRLSSLIYIDTIASELSLCDQSIDIISIFAFSLSQQSYISMKLSTKMMITVCETIANKESNKLLAIRICYSVLKFINDSLILVLDDDIAGVCYLLRVLYKLLKDRIFCGTFIQYDEFFMPLIDIMKKEKHYELFFLVFQCVNRLLLTDCYNPIIQVMFFFPSFQILQFLVDRAKDILSVKAIDKMLKGSLQSFISIIGNCPYTKSIVFPPKVIKKGVYESDFSNDEEYNQQKNEVFIVEIHRFLRDRFPMCAIRARESLYSNEVDEASDFNSIIEFFSK